MKLFFNLFRGLKNNKVEYLKLENINLTQKNINLNVKLSEEINKSNELETLLKSTLNELTEVNTKNNELKTSNILLEKEVLKKIQLIEIKDNQHKEEKKELNKKIKELEKELDKRYIIKKLPSGRPPKGQKMSIKSSAVQSKIIKNLKGEDSENI